MSTEHQFHEGGGDNIGGNKVKIINIETSGIFIILLTLVIGGVFLFLYWQKPVAEEAGEVEEFRGIEDVENDETAKDCEFKIISGNFSTFCIDKEDSIYLYGIDITYPQIEVCEENAMIQMINNKLKHHEYLVIGGVDKIFEDCDSAQGTPFLIGTYESTYEIVYSNKYLLAIVYIIGDNVGGGVKTHFYPETLNLDLRNGKIIELDDLFREQGYRQVIQEHMDDYVINELAVDSTGVIAFEENTKYYINGDKKELVFYFNREDYGFLGAGRGIDSIAVSFGALWSLIDRDGPLFLIN